MSADDHPKTDTDNEASEAASEPALFATIHHKSEDRPDGYSDEDIGELNRIANGKAEAPRKEKRTALLASAAALVLVAGVVGGAWAMKAWEGSRSPTEPTSAPTPPGIRAIYSRTGGSLFHTWGHGSSGRLCGTITWISGRSDGRAGHDPDRQRRRPDSGNALRPASLRERFDPLYRHPSVLR